MKRLNESELDARIHRFLGRKLAEYPDLRADRTKPEPIEHDTGPKPRRHRPFHHWSVETS